MNMDAKNQYFKEIRIRYITAEKSEKSSILNEFCIKCLYNRKYAIRLLHKGHKPPSKRKRKGRHSKYHSENIINFLKHLWVATNNICSSRLKVVIPTWLPFYQKPLSRSDKELLLNISSRTIDRLLKPLRTSHGKLGLSTTRPGSLLKKHIPIKTNQWNEFRPGFIEADTVAHCGNSVSGQFVYTLNIVDIATGWTEARALWGKGQTGVFNALNSIKSSLPFEILGFDSDNGSEFINHYLFSFFLHQKINFTRSREYYKNDNAHIEQKNWTNIRQYLGYLRFDNPDILPLLQDLFINEWPLFFNFFIPSVKIISKERVGAKLIKKHDPPKSPFQRLLDSEFVSASTKNDLSDKFVTLNPFLLQSQIVRKINAILSLANTGTTSL